MKKVAVALAASLLVLGLAEPASARQPAQQPPAEPTDPLPPAVDPLATPPGQADPPPPEPAPPYTPPEPRYRPRPPPELRPAVEEEPEAMSEGRRIVVAYNTGFQWGLVPGVVFSNNKTSFYLGVRLGYGFDTGKVIVVPGVRLSGFFSDPNVYVGMPVAKLVYPIDRFAPFIEGGAGIGYIAGYNVNRVSVDPETGLALFAGAGFMVHFSWKFGLGVEGTYQTITGTGFSGFGIGPIIALAF